MNKHMRQLLTFLNLTGSFIVLALTIDLFDTMFMFLLFGILPNRSESLSANQMLIIYGTASAIVAGFALRSSLMVLFDSFKLSRSQHSRV